MKSSAAVGLHFIKNPIKKKKKNQHRSPLHNSHQELSAVRTYRQRLNSIKPHLCVYYSSLQSRHTSHLQLLPWQLYPEEDGLWFIVLQKLLELTLSACGKVLLHMQGKYCCIPKACSTVQLFRLYSFHNPSGKLKECSHQETKWADSEKAKEVPVPVPVLPLVALQKGSAAPSFLRETEWSR